MKPKKSWFETIEKELKISNVTEEIALNCEFERYD